MVGNEQALTYLKERYTEELQRFRDVEDKSIKLTSLLSVLMAALGTGLGINREPLISPTLLIDWIIIVLSGLIFIFLLISWSNAMLAINISRYPIVPANRVALEYITEADKEDCEAYIIQCHIDVIELLSIVIEKKAEALFYCHRFLIISGWISSILLVSFYISEINHG
ncbi:hypothetical protein R3F64_13440 [Halomonas sp. 5021]|uniref:hypothetical protein n=1 Tax=Halomonas sp. 5021 TaxID=3082156 RepID=UPI002FCC7332